MLRYTLKIKNIEKIFLLTLNLTKFIKNNYWYTRIQSRHKSEGIQGCQMFLVIFKFSSRFFILYILGSVISLELRII